eukprot:TRINITY_DN2588_c0_g2_i1.p1 TRINITY_DN2588_c0_g2~~TRINITY_DN2588_c0_g2_i1.p1  ORF type:complete len:340 (-),score=38.43 TRINITY_DN2588_c0_g2_i1:8-913(-)
MYAVTQITAESGHMFQLSLVQVNISSGSLQTEVLLGNFFDEIVVGYGAITYDKQNQILYTATDSFNTATITAISTKTMTLLPPVSFTDYENVNDVQFDNDGSGDLYVFLSSLNTTNLQSQDILTSVNVQQGSHKIIDDYAKMFSSSYFPYMSGTFDWSNMTYYQIGLKVNASSRDLTRYLTSYSITKNSGTIKQVMSCPGYLLFSQYDPTLKGLIGITIDQRTQYLNGVVLVNTDTATCTTKHSLNGKVTPDTILWDASSHILYIATQNDNGDAGMIIYNWDKASSTHVALTSPLANMILI